MTPNVATAGHSFKGAFAYYLHDKGQDAHGERLESSERVAWTETRNLATDDPSTAKRIMTATARQAEELKDGAGVKATGAKKKIGPVYSYSLSWRSDEAEGVSRADMVKAADDTIKLLKADHLQAVIIAHNDTENPHVHVVINRVDPNTGKQHNFYGDYIKLDRWAGKYERDRGVIVTPKRQAKEQAREANPDPDKRRAYVQNRLKEQESRQSAAAALKARGDAQRATHREQWAKLATDQKTQRRAIYEAADGKIKERLRFAREEYRPLWSDLHSSQKAERRAHEARERHLSGKVQNAIDAVRSRQIRGDGSDRGFLSMAFGYLASRDARRAELESRQAAERDRFSATAKAQNAAAITAIKDERSRAIAAEREKAAQQVTALKTAQAAQTRQIREEWRAIYQAKEQARAAQERPPREHRPRIRQHTKDARRETRAAWSNESTRRAEVSRRYAEARQAEKPAPQEPEAMKDRFDKVRGDQRPDAPPIPNRTVSLSRPTPAPSPAGEVPAVHRKPAPVPAIVKDAELKPMQAKPAPTPRFDWQRAQPYVPPQKPQQDRAQQPPQDRGQQTPRPAAFDWKQEQGRPAPAPAHQPPQDRGQQPPDHRKITVDRADADRQHAEHLKAARQHLSAAQEIERDVKAAEARAAAMRTERDSRIKEHTEARDASTVARWTFGIEANRMPPAAPSRAPERQAERDTPPFDWAKSAPPEQAPAPERTDWGKPSETPRFDWGKAVEPSRDTSSEPSKPVHDRERDYDPNR